MEKVSNAVLLGTARFPDKKKIIVSMSSKISFNAGDKTIWGDMTIV